MSYINTARNTEPPRTMGLSNDCGILPFATVFSMLPNASSMLKVVSPTVIPPITAPSSTDWLTKDISKPITLSISLFRKRESRIYNGRKMYWF